MKKLLSLLVVSAMVVSLCACGSNQSTQAPAETAETTEATETTEGTTEATGVMPALAKEDIKVGVIHITDPAEGSGYTYTHDLVIHGIQKNI